MFGFLTVEVHIQKMAKPLYLTKSRYMNGLSCHKMLWLGWHDPLPYSKPEPGSPQEVGTVVGHFAQFLFPGGVLINEAPWEHELAIQHLYLKRKRLVHGTRWWSMITYAKYDERDKNPCSMELEECEENDVPEMLEMFDVRKDVTIGGLREMGWNGTHTETAEIFYPDFAHKAD